MKTNTPTKQQEYAAQFGVFPSRYTAIKKGYLFTDDKSLAIHMAKHYGKSPIEYISPDRREVYLKLWPSMGKIRKG